MAQSFDQLGLQPAILSAIKAVGYETPSAIQAQAIPALLSGRDLIGQAQTGTGKTAAFALPLLSRLDLGKSAPQVLVLTPTRELSIQVAEAFQKYAAGLKGFHVLPVYGGQDYRGQLRALQRGVHVVVGTPGRVMDHMRRGSLKLDGLSALVLDEADEMLRMGFIDDVEWVLEQTPQDRQVALFSATLPAPIKRIALQHLNQPDEVMIKLKASTAETINQRYWLVGGLHKLDALTRILEAESFDAMIVFVRTKLATQDLADRLAARGYAAAALNGDIEQRQRERTVEQLKSGRLDIIVATDVAARGLDVERISHVVNYDIPHDTEAYVHRIGRTGRAGRSGEAILFVAPRERRLLRAIEKATRQPISLMELPTTELINDKRIARFKQGISDTLAQESDDLGLFRQLLEQYQSEHDVPALDIAAALACQRQGDSPLLLKSRPTRAAGNKRGGEREPRAQARKDTQRPSQRDSQPSREGVDKTARPARDKAPPKGYCRYRVEVGSAHNIQAGNLVGAIANEAGLDAQHIGRIQIEAEHSLVELPEGMPKDIFRDLKKVWVGGRQLRISHADGTPDKPPRKAAKPKPAGKGKAKSKGRKRANAAPRKGG